MTQAITLSDYIKKLQAIEKAIKTAELKPFAGTKKEPLMLLLSDDHEGNGYHQAFEAPGIGFIPKNEGRLGRVDPDAIYSSIEEAKQMGYTGELKIAVFL